MDKPRTTISSAKDLSLILLVFFFPLALYLLVLGLVNRRYTPFLVSGVCDGIGLLFGVSGFLLFAGPAVFSSFRERWRLYWLFGAGNAPSAGAEGVWQFWIFLSILYFLLVVGGAAYYLWRQRGLTAIYNADAVQIEKALTQICERLELHPLRSGNLFLFGSAFDEKIPQPTAVLELDDFALMRHVTLRWDAADSPLRATIERELSELLAQTSCEENPLGGWLLTLGCLLLTVEMAGVFVVVLLRALVR